MKNSQKSFETLSKNPTTEMARLKGDHLGFFNILPVAKYQKKLGGDHLMQSKNFRKKVCAEKLTRRERLKSALYLRLKKRKTFFLENVAQCRKM